MKTLEFLQNQFEEEELTNEQLSAVRGGDGPGTGPETDPDPPVIIVPEEG